MMNEITIDKDLKRLEELVSEMESGELDLDKALERFQEGVALVKRVSEALKNAELQVREITDEGLKDFRPENGQPA